MNIMLINPPAYFSERLSCLSQNLALGYLAAYILEKSKNKHRINIIDAVADGQDTILQLGEGKWERKRIGLKYEDILARIPIDTDIVGITGPFNHTAEIIAELSKIIKTKYPDKLIILGGAFPSSLPERALTSGVDYVVIGEGEIPMLQIADGMEPREIQGVLYRDKNGAVMGHHGKANIISDLDEIPFPARHLLPFEKYANLSPRGMADSKTISIITSRGCPFDCSFCSIHSVYSRKWRSRTSENVLDEIEHCVTHYRVNHIEFEDDNLTIDKGRAIAIFEGIRDLRRRVNNTLDWSASNGFRIDTLDEEILQKMKESGCTHMVLAMEHGDPAILEAMDKRLDLAKVEEVAGICKKLNLNIHVFLMVGYPGETRESYLKSLRFSKHIKQLGAVKRFEVFITNPVAGTRLAQYCKERGFLADDPDLAAFGFLHQNYGGIITPEFDSKEVCWRRKYAERALSPLIYRAAINNKQIILKFVPIKTVTGVMRKLGL